MRKVTFWLLLMAAAVIPATALVPATAQAAGWNAVNAPLGALGPGATGASLLADSCPATGFCVAVGSYSDQGAREGLIETVNGSTITPLSAPLSGLDPTPAGNPGVTLIRVACASMGSCAATGIYSDQNNKSHSFAEVLSGTTWRATTLPLTGLNPAPDPGSAVSDLETVTCPAAGTCVAVGAYGDSSHGSLPLVERLASGAWTGQSAPISGLTTATTGSLLDVSCSNTSACLAVGGTDGGDGDLVETFNGSTWSGSTPSFAGVSPAPEKGFNNRLSGTLSNVSCSRTGDCQAVGEYFDEAGHQQGLLIGLGGSETATTALDLNHVSPKPFSNPLVQFGGVDCRPGCTDVAAYTDNGKAGSTGRDDTVVTPTGQFVAPVTGLAPGPLIPHSFTLQRFACPSAANCVAVGQYADNRGGADAAVEAISLSGNTGTAATPGLGAVSPAGASPTNSTLGYVACPGTGRCLAVGNYVDASQTFHGMLAYPGPVVSRVAPNSGPIQGGNTVTIVGAGFASGATVTFGAAASSSVTLVSPAKLQAVVPAGSAGTDQVTVTVAGASSLTSAGDGYTYAPPPTVSRVAPGAGPTTGGGGVEIDGSNFTPSSIVRFGSTPASSVALLAPGVLEAGVPAHAAGTVRVSVRTAFGVSASTAAADYTYGPPAVTSVTPGSGHVHGGNTVAIAGSGFSPDASVSFGSNASATVTFHSPTKLQARVPAGTAGTVDVQVTTGGGTSPVARPGDRYTYDP